MSLDKIFILDSNTISGLSVFWQEKQRELIRLSMWASEAIPFNPVEKAFPDNYRRLYLKDERPCYHLVHEYPLDGKPSMMTHIFESNSGDRIIAAKGGHEALIALAEFTFGERGKIANAMHLLTNEGYRVLGVGEAYFDGENFTASLKVFKFHFRGTIAFYDPLKKNINKVLSDFYKAGISVKIIMGDNALTTIAIARQIGFAGIETSLTCEELILLSEEELEGKVLQVNIFTRMFPEAKLRIINALKAKGQIVAMTGDGANDGPALKAAHISNVMRQKGTEIAKEASSLILLEVDLSKIVDAVEMGRKIYSNLRKAFRYIISIHIPIILTVFVPLLFGWIYTNILSPVHIIFLESIMGPTCSIIFENEPIESNVLRETQGH